MRRPEVYTEVIEQSRRRRAGGGGPPSFIASIPDIATGLWLRADRGTSTTPGTDALAGLDVLTEWEDQSGGDRTPTIIGVPTLEEVDGLMGVRLRKRETAPLFDYFAGLLTLNTTARMTLHVVQVPDTSKISPGCGIFDLAQGATGNTNVSMMALSESPQGMMARVGTGYQALNGVEANERQLWTYDYGPVFNRLFLNGVLISTSSNQGAITHSATTHYRIGLLFQDVYPAQRLLHELVALPRQMTDDERGGSTEELLGRWEIAA